MNPILSPGAALGAAATLGVADFAGGVAGRRTPAPSVTMGIEVCGLVAFPLALLVLPMRWDLQPAVFAFAGGAAGGLGLIAFYRAMTLNLIGVVAPIAAVVGAAFPTVVGLLTGDHLHPGQFAGIGTGLIAIVLINGWSRETTRAARTALGLSLVAGALFGLFFIFAHAASSVGVVAYLGSRAGSAATSICFALITGVSVVPRRAAWRLIAVGGACDGVGGILYLYATFHGLLSLSALLTSFYPAFTILCARLFTHERLTWVQAAGGALAVIAVALIAAT